MGSPIFRSSWMYESMTGFEPMNTSFAEKPLKPLGYIDIYSSDNRFPFRLCVKVENALKQKAPGKFARGFVLSMFLIEIYFITFVSGHIISCFCFLQICFLDFIDMVLPFVIVDAKIYDLFDDNQLFDKKVRLRRS
jgi:hypothetical protein